MLEEGFDARPSEWTLAGRQVWQKPNCQDSQENCFRRENFVEFFLLLVKMKMTDDLNYYLVKLMEFEMVTTLQAIRNQKDPWIFLK